MLENDTLQLEVELIHGEILWANRDNTNKECYGTRIYQYSVFSECDTIIRSIGVDYLDSPRYDVIPDIDTCIFKGMTFPVSYPFLIQKI